jgi:hypothetical protein
MNEVYKLNRNIFVKGNYDVVVVGGGASGTFAAISSAMKGAKTMLIEKNGKLGGTITSAGVNFPGLFHAWGKQIISGPCWDSVKRATEFDNIELPDFSKIPVNHWEHQIPINLFTYSVVLDTMCEEVNVDVRLHTMVSYSEETEDGVYVINTSKEGLWAVKTKVLIDATGDANVAGILGYERVRSETLQPGTLINNICGYDRNNLNKVEIEAREKKAIEEGIINREDVWSGLYNQLKSGRISMHITDADGSTSEGRTYVEIKARKTLFKLVSFLKTIPGLENLTVDYCAEECGIRETYRIVGEKIINADEYINGYVYDDAVCYGFYPIDLHVQNGIKQVFLQEGIAPTVPYGALIPKGSERLLVAGRCISGDADSISALRVQAPCMAMGQAAGVAAYIASRDNIRVSEVDIDELKKQLADIGAVVPF